MEQEKDHYERLGVIDTTELAVIKAAYKALMQIYHPDRFDSEIEKANATQIAKEINEAYRVLSDPLLRKKYDEYRAKSKNEYNPETGNAAEDKQKNDILEDSWKIAARYVENLEGIYNALADISPELGFTFKLELIESKKFDKAKAIASRLEKEYLERYFGANRNVQNFAKWLLLNDKRQIALEVNKATVVLGKRFNANKFIDSFITKYELTYQRQNKRRIRWLISFFVLLGALFCIKPFFEEVLLLDIEAKEGSCKNWSIPYEIRRVISNHAKKERANASCSVKGVKTEGNVSIAPYRLTGACGEHKDGEEVYGDVWRSGNCGTHSEEYMTGLMNENIIKPIRVGGGFDFYEEDININENTIELDGREYDSDSMKWISETKKFKIEQNGFHEITIEAGVSPVDLRGVYHLRKFQNHGFFGNMITGEYDHLQLNYAIRFTDKYKSGTVMNVNAVALQAEKPDLISTIKDGDEINVHCNFLYDGKEVSPHYAPLVHCVADSIKKVETKK
jgi:curved DNA-binding protein CbpA